MKFPVKPKSFAKLSICLLALTSLHSLAATSIIQFIKNDPDTPLQSYLDPFYNDGNSTVFLGQSLEGDITGELSARYYDSDPVRPGTNGLINSDLPWNRADPATPEPGWLVRFGLNPDDQGVFVHTHDKGGPQETVVPASYISFNLKSPETVIYQTASLVIDNTTGVTPTDVWAVASTENFTITRLATFSSSSFNNVDGNRLQWDWEDLQITSQGLEIRVYGIQGSDEGYFGVGSVITTFDPPPVPEASTSICLGIGAISLLARRKRRAR